MVCGRKVRLGLDRIGAGLRLTPPCGPVVGLWATMGWVGGNTGHGTIRIYIYIYGTNIIYIYIYMFTSANPTRSWRIYRYLAHMAHMYCFLTHCTMYICLYIIVFSMNTKHTKHTHTKQHGRVMVVLVCHGTQTEPSLVAPIGSSNGGQPFFECSKGPICGNARRGHESKYGTPTILVVLLSPYGYTPRKYDHF